MQASGIHEIIGGRGEGENGLWAQSPGTRRDIQEERDRGGGGRPDVPPGMGQLLSSPGDFVLCIDRGGITVHIRF